MTGLGAMFETAVVNDIRRQTAALPLVPGFWHWRSAGGAKVDLILEKDGVLYPVEVRLTSQPRPRDATGLNAFRAAYPERRIAPGLIVCAANAPGRVTETVYAVPWNWLVA